MGQTFFAKWKHRIRDAWLVLTGQAWVGHGNPMDWQYMEGSHDDAVADAAARAVLTERAGA